MKLCILNVCLLQHTPSVTAVVKGVPGEDMAGGGVGGVILETSVLYTVSLVGQ